MRPTRAKTPARTPGGLGGIRTPARTPLRTGARLRVQTGDGPKDPVEVFCRVRPSQGEEEESCIKVLSDTLIQLTPPLASRAYLTGKETQYSFKGRYCKDSY